ncbi:MAG: hypothetical protein K0V04_04240 [Deltaproteobacteria bacterium]|nr:hypothetical protein [Deltaproteobacteria bacterium]
MSSGDTTANDESDTGLPEPGTSTGLDQGEPIAEAVGQWQCTGYGDPLAMAIDELRIEPASVEGIGCGAKLAPGPILKGDNCSPLSIVDGRATIRLGFTLPYPSLEEFGPIDLEFRGQYDPALDQLTGQMWNSELDETNDSICERLGA